MNQTKKIIPLIFLSIALSCTNPDQKDNFDTFKESVASIQPGVSKISDVAWLIEKSEADYIPELNLNTGIIKIYMQEDTLSFLENKVLSSAIMGMYSADIAYNLVFYKREMAFESFSAAKIIANSLGIGDVYVDNVFARIEDEDFSVDTLLVHFDRGLSRFNSEKTDQDRLRIIIGFFIGNYIEKQYQYHSTIQSYKLKDIPDEEKLLLAKEFIYVALNQEVALEAIIQSIKNNQYEDDPGYLYEKFIDLKAIYSGIMPLKDKMDSLSPEDIFQNPKFDEMYLNIKELRNDLAFTIDKEIV